jgi:hypothetical protein
MTVNERKQTLEFLKPAPAGGSFARPAFDSGWWQVFGISFFLFFVIVTSLLPCHPQDTSVRFGM